jgi:uncharacterized protein (TIGR01777 family)
MTKVIISGGSGMIGANLTKNLEKKGHEVVWLSRNLTKTKQASYFWDPETGQIDLECLKGVGAIINLAGAGVADKRWTPDYMDEILNSRIKATELLYQTLKNNPNEVKTFLSASAVGIYGNNPTDNTNEAGPLGDTFLAEVCQKWEQKAMEVSSLGIRTGIVRIGIVLSEQGGFVKEISGLAKWGLAAALGKGSQQTPWIHLNDLSRIFIHILEYSFVEGVFNGVAPASESNIKLTQLICKAMHRPMFLPPVPVFILSIMVGKMAPMLLANQSISAEKILQSGFMFEFPDAKFAIEEIFGSSKSL